MRNITDIPKTLKSTLVDSELSSLAECGIDSLLSDGVAKDIPIIGTLVGLIKTSQNISSWLLLKKLVLFLNAIEGVDCDTRKRMINKIDGSSEYRSKIGEKLLFIIDRCEDDEKANLVGLLFKALLQEIITYDEFVKGTIVLNNITVKELNIFLKQKEYTPEDADFISAGLLCLYMEDITVQNEINGDWDDPQNFSTTGGELEVYISNIGEKFKIVFNTDKI